MKNVLLVTFLLLIVLAGGYVYLEVREQQLRTAENQEFLAQTVLENRKATILIVKAVNTNTLTIAQVYKRLMRLEQREHLTRDRK